MWVFFIVSILSDITLNKIYAIMKHNDIKWRANEKHVAHKLMNKLDPYCKINWGEGRYNNNTILSWATTSTHGNKT